ncbi:MAG TPA: hypothetical protein VIN04_11885 [Myxococcota bacterium]
MTTKGMRALGFGISTALLALAPAAQGASTAYTERAAFDAAIAGHGDVRVLDFESVPAGTTIASGESLEGVTFTFEIEGGFDLIVLDSEIDEIDTTSGSRSLGVEEEGVPLPLLAGDGFTLGFDRVVHAVGIYVIAGAIGGDIQPGDIMLRVPGRAAVTNGAEPDLVLGDGGEAYFLGLVEDDPAAGFTSAEVITILPPEGTERDFDWNADDIVTAVVPEPAAGGAGLVALVVLSGLARRAARGARC